MIVMKRAVREASILFFSAALLSFAYTFFTSKGIFSNTSPSASIPPSPPMIHISEAESLFNAGDALFIDARHSFDYRMGHIKGAINIPLAEYEQMKDVVNTLQKDKIIVVYCDGAQCNSSIQFAVRLSSDGFTRAKIFFGGWREWEERQLPMEKELTE
jgi:rhodanese-related sulfurtransferase